MVHLNSAAPLFEPVEAVAERAAEIRETLQRYGNAQNACRLYGASLALILNSAP